jgi:hypothetical protein
MNDIRGARHTRLRDPDDSSGSGGGGGDANDQSLQHRSRDHVGVGAVPIGKMALMVQLTDVRAVDTLFSRAVLKHANRPDSSHVKLITRARGGATPEECGRVIKLSRYITALADIKLNNSNHVTSRSTRKKNGI